MLVNPPFYFPMSNDEVVRYFEGVVQASPVPVLLYNIPGMTKVAVDAATLLRLRDVGVQGTKDSSGDPQNLLAYLNAMRGEAFRVIVGGDGMLLHALISGVAGTTGPAPNVAPQLVTAIYNAWCDGDLDAAAAAQNRQNAFLRALSGASPFMQATAKGVLSRLGNHGAVGGAAEDIAGRRGHRRSVRSRARVPAGVRAGGGRRLSVAFTK